jgi:dienelactone hydrolase
MHPACPSTVLLAAAALHAPGAVAQSSVQTAEVRFPVRDSLAVVADVHRGARGLAGPTVILLHQGGGSARGEYRSITPRLIGEGYNVIAADVRGGGDRFGSPNRAGPAPEGFDYCDALPEVEATVNLARAGGFTGPLVLWGSSYTASLVLQVAARRSAEVEAVLAFSPASGEPMRRCEPAVYVGWLARAGVPALVLRPRAEVEDSGRAAALEAMRRDGAATFVAERAAHGSSMLDAERSAGPTEPQWTAVLGFLRRALEPPPPVTGERTVAIPSDGWTLRADLRLPEQRPAPLAILLHKAAGDRAIYRELSARLAAQGIGSLRVDLRGHGESVDRGRFIPGQTLTVLEGTDRDVAAVWRFVRGLAGVDTSRLAVVSGSYSSEAATRAARAAGFGRAHVALSPGDFSDDSFRAAAGSGAVWLFIRSDEERFVGAGLDAKVRALAPEAELWVVPAGSAHATDLLAADPGLAGRLSDWLVRRLAGTEARSR